VTDALLCHAKDFPLESLVERCQGLEDRLAPLLRTAYRRVGACPCVVQLADLQGAAVHLTKECLPKPDWMGWFRDWMSYPNFDAVYAWMGHEVSCPRLYGPQDGGLFHRERWGLVGSYSQADRFEAKLGVEEKGRWGCFALRRTEVISDYIPALCSLNDDVARSAHYFLYKLDLLEDALARRLGMTRVRLVGRLEIAGNDPDISGCMIEFDDLRYIEDALCGYCGKNGDAKVPTMQMEICGARIHQDCLVRLAEPQPDGSGLAPCFIYGCKEMVRVPREVMDRYPLEYAVENSKL